LRGKMENQHTEFDKKSYVKINKERELWLKKCIDDIPVRDSLKTALDLGCGAGYFSNMLSNLGFKVTGMDLQASNIEVCRARYPEVTFDTINLDEEFNIEQRCDLVLLFGILYHLQSPLQTILRLKDVIGQIAIIETRVSPGDAMACYLFQENAGDAHNTARVTAVPTLPAFVGMFQAAGFDYIYRPNYQPDHEHWKELPNGQRHCFVVSRTPVDVPGWSRLVAPPFIKKWKPIRGSIGLKLRALTFWKKTKQLFGM